MVNYKLYLSIIVFCLSLAIKLLANETQKFIENFLNSDIEWQEVVEQAKKEKYVNFYFYDGSNELELWISSYLKQYINKKYNILINPYPISSAIDVFDILDFERQEGKTFGEGNVDIILMQGLSFKLLKENDLLMGSFADLLPNSRNFDFDENSRHSYLNLYDFGIETEKKEMPWSKEHFVCYINRENVPANLNIETFDELYKYLETNPGKFTYISPESFLGLYFVFSVLYDQINDSKVLNKEFSSYSLGEIKTILYPGFYYLKKLHPFLYGGNGDGSSFKQIKLPKSYLEYQQLYLDNHINMACTIGTYIVSKRIASKVLPETTEIMTFPKIGSITAKSYLGISKYSPHPAASLLLINELSSFVLQEQKIVNLGYFTAMDFNKVSENQQNRLLNAYSNTVDINMEEFIEREIAYTHSSFIEPVKYIWENYINQNIDENTITEIITEAYEKYATKN